MLQFAMGYRKAPANASQVRVAHVQFRLCSLVFVELRALDIAEPVQAFIPSFVMPAAMQRPVVAEMLLATRFRKLPPASPAGSAVV